MLNLSPRRKIWLIKRRSGADVKPLHRGIEPAWRLAKLHGTMDVTQQWRRRLLYWRLVCVPSLRV